MFLFKKSEITKKLFFNSRTSLAFVLKFLNLLFQILSIYFLANSFSSSELGLYYLFMSFFGLQILVDLGFTKTMSIFVSHESNKIIFSNTSIKAEVNILQRIKTILTIVFRWFIKSSFWLFLAYLLLGIVFFIIKDKDIEIFLLWISLSLLSCISLYSSIITSFLQGVNQINKANTYASIQLIVSNILFFSTINSFGLYSMLFKTLGTVIVFLIYIGYYRRLILFLLRLKIPVELNIKKLFLKQQKKFAFTAILGFFILNIFIPFSYYFVSPEFSGKLGMTFQITNTFSAFMMIFFNINFPLLSHSISINKYKSARLDFYYILKLICLLLLIGYISFFFLKEILFFKNLLNHKILTSWNLVLIVIGSIGFLYVDLFSSFLRLFKSELFVKHSLISLLLSVLMLSTLGIFYQNDGVLLAYVLLALFGVFNVSIIFIKHQYNERS